MEKLELKYKDIVKQIINKYKPEKIIIFGSVVKGEFTQDSDIDFLVIKSGVPQYGVERIREISRLIQRDTACDFLVYKPEEIEERVKLGDPFIKNILKEGKIVYG